MKDYLKALTTETWNFVAQVQHLTLAILAEPADTAAQLRQLANVRVPLSRIGLLLNEIEDEIRNPPAPANQS